MSWFHRRPVPPQQSCTGPHVSGQWHACSCDQAIADHQDEFFEDGSCAFEQRACRFCSALRTGTPPTAGLSDPIEAGSFTLVHPSRAVWRRWCAQTIE
jgi:hypothetical protein